MKLEIYGEEEQEDKNRLRLVRYCGNIYLALVSEGGNVIFEGYLSRINLTPEGKISVQSINEKCLTQCPD